MKRLVAFGCSYTFGHGLVDCIKDKVGPGPNPSKFAWPSLLANKLDRQCINLSWPGSSNFEILNRILNFEFEPDDLVVVMWSFWGRHAVFDENPDYFYTFLPGVENEKYEEWLNLHTNHDLKIRTWIYKHHAHSYFKAKNIPFYFLTLNITHEDFLNVRPKWANDINFLPTSLDKLNRFYPLALDGSHPGPGAHEAAAEEIFEFIKNK